MTGPAEAPLNVVGAVFTRVNEHTDTFEVLAFRRSAHKVAAGLWEFAGGKIESGETPQEALVREIREELAIDVAVDKLVLRNEMLVGDRHVTLHCFYVTAHVALPTSSTDHDELLWMPVSDLHTLDWIAPDVAVVEALQARLG